MDISTHTLTWSVTGVSVADSEGNINFNSHAHVERDQVDMFTIFVLIISTHTLTWSVTSLVVAVNFNITISTHTLTWSVTCYQGGYVSIEINFNSHAHVERDRSGNFTIPKREISTHTLTWSVTLFKVVTIRDKHISTHTLTWSVTCEIHR